MSIITALLERPAIYRLWQRPFADHKMAPFRRHNDMSQLGRVLDVGCGPGTNAPQFAGTDYLGVDINPKYIAYARARFPGRFEVADARSFSLSEPHPFDCIIVNSLLHHLEDGVVRSLFSGLSRCVSSAGAIHVLELVQPTGHGVDSFLARGDRGQFSRSVERWGDLVSRYYNLEVLEPYSLQVGGLVLWNMVYIRGRPR
jgi:SAM-dependent methyltransferase